MSVRLNPAQALNQQFSVVKQTVSTFDSSTPQDRILDTKQKLESMQAELKGILTKTPMAIMTLALADKGIPQLLKRCQSLAASSTPPVKKEVSVSNVANQATTVHKVHHHAATLRRKDHPLKGRFEATKAFDERFKSGNLNRASTTQEPKPAQPITTEIKVHCNLPFGHTLTVRGEGAGLDWEKGVALEKIDEETYVYRKQGVVGSAQYKILLDDSQWEIVDNRSIEAQKSQEITPNLTLPIVPVVVNYDGAGKLYIFCNGPGMSWDKGIELKQVDRKWAFETDSKFDKFDYKIVLNSTQWEQSDNRQAEIGKTDFISPKF
jgi:hypothetical protein